MLSSRDLEQSFDLLLVSNCVPFPGFSCCKFEFGAMLANGLDLDTAESLHFF